MPNETIIAILQGILQHKVITSEEKALLAQDPATNPASLSPGNENALAVQLKWFPVAYTTISDYCNEIGLSQTETLQDLWQIWLPLALNIADKKAQRQSALIQGILGLQGTGKTTLSTILRLLLTQFGYHTVTLSIDDLYKTYADRQQLQNDDPRLIWRGPPGTHDVEVGISVLDQIQAGQTPISIPRFDKSAVQGMGDHATPEIITDQIDILLFEGWFVGVKPIPERALQSPPPPLTTEADRQFAIDNNRRLAAYLPLWKRLDGLIILSPVDYRFSQQWRKQAEQKMIAQGRSGMSEAEINQFVEYFWRSLHPDLFMTPLIECKEGVDFVIQLDANHRPIRID